MQLLYLAKVVARRSYAEDILDGRLRFSPLSYFIKREKAEEDAGRSDPDEGSAVIQGDRISDITVKDHPFEFGFQRMSFSLPHVINNCHVLCMFAGHTGNFEGNPRDDSNTDDFRRQIGFPSQRLRKEFGEYTVRFLNLDNFHALMGRIDQECNRKGYCGRGGLVEYYNEHRDNVGIDGSDSLRGLDVAFYKRAHYSYQQEYRVALSGADSGGHVVLEIGDIRDIAVLMETRNVGSSLRPHFREKRR